MLEKTDSDYDLFENYEINESPTKENLAQDLKESSLEDLSQDFVEDFEQNLVVDLEENIPQNLHQGLSEELVKELEKEFTETLDQVVPDDLVNEGLLNEGLLNEDLSNECLANEYLSKTPSNNLEENKTNDSFSHYKKYTSKKPRSRFFNWSISFAKLFLFIMLLPIILLILSLVGGTILTFLGMGIGLIASSIASLIFMAFYISSLTKSVILLFIALSVTLFSSGLFILLVGFIILKKFIMLMTNYYKSKRETKEASVL